jgi:hypothetical protein
MKKTRFTEQQMVRILREADATPVVEVARKHGIWSCPAFVDTSCSQREVHQMVRKVTRYAPGFLFSARLARDQGVRRERPN